MWGGGDTHYVGSVYWVHHMRPAWKPLGATHTPWRLCGPPSSEKPCVPYDIPTAGDRQVLPPGHGIKMMVPAPNFPGLSHHTTLPTGALEGPSLARLEVLVQSGAPPALRWGHDTQFEKGCRLLQPLQWFPGSHQPSAQLPRPKCC